MSVALTDDALEIGSVLRSFLAERSPEAAVRRAMETSDGFDAELWQQLNDELQLCGLLVPEDLGGVGLGWLELGAVFEEFGGSLACVPYLATVGQAVTALLASGDDAACADLLPSIADGSSIATVAVAEPGAGWEPGAVATTAQQAGGSWRLDGEKSFIVDGHLATTFLVVARAGHRVGLFAVDGRADGLSRRALITMDATRRLADVRLQHVVARLVGTLEDGPAIVERAMDLAGIALAAEQVGGAQRALDQAVEYAKVRVQFGRPIGAFQAVKHKLADLLVDTVTARAAAYDALAAADGSGASIAEAASVAQAWCSDAFLHVAEENIQVHGGIGMTWEHPAHLYLKRAKTSQLLLGDPAYHRRRLAALLDAQQS